MLTDRDPEALTAALGIGDPDLTPRARGTCQCGQSGSTHERDTARQIDLDRVADVTVRQTGREEWAVSIAKGEAPTAQERATDA